MKPELRVALLGQGFMGRAHSNAWLQAGRFFDLPYRIRRKVICGRDSSQLARMAADWEWDETAADWRAVIERADVDLIDIALPNHLHAPVAIAALEAGKMVLCEKPLANTRAEAEAMAHAARGKVTGVWFNYRRVPAIQQAARLINDGRLGNIYHYRATYLQQGGIDVSRMMPWKLDPELAGAGVIGDLMSHLVDTAHMLNGPIREVTAMSRMFAERRRVQDAAWALAHFENQSEGSFEATRFAVGCRNRNSFEIHGSGGMLRFNFEDMNRLEFLDTHDADEERGPRNILCGNPYWKPGHIIGYEHTFISAAADFLQALHKGQRFRPDFEDGLAVQSVLDAVERSSASRQWEQIKSGSADQAD